MNRSSLGASREASDLFKSVSLLQSFIYSIDNESLTIENKYNLLLDLILILENAADVIQTSQGESVFQSLMLYKEAIKYKEHLWKLEDKLCSKDAMENMENEMRTNLNSQYPTFIRAITRQRKMVDTESLENVSSATLRNILTKSCLLGFSQPCDKVNQKENIDTANVSVDSHEKYLPPEDRNTSYFPKSF